MIKVLISINDKSMVDVIATACRQFPELEPHEVPLPRIFELLGQGNCEAIIVDFYYKGQGIGEFVKKIREADSSIDILCLLEKDHRDRHNRLKIDLDIFSFIPVPLDAFELAKRLQRLVARRAPLLMPTYKSDESSPEDKGKS